MRSKLFVPGSRPELLAKALATDADAISIDLEDSVLESRKNEARENVVEFLHSAAALSCNKIIIVRCNALGTKHFDADIAAITLPGLGIVNLPKVESAIDIQVVAGALQSAEARNRVASPIGILATIESPSGMRLAATIATAEPRVLGLQLGLNDLFESLNIDRRDAANIHAAMFALRMAAGEAGVYALDGAFANIHDEQGFRDEAETARRLGFSGKSCIHPRQIAAANETFVPTEVEVAAATRIVEASMLAEAEGRGAFTMDGKMMDVPSIQRAKQIVASSRCGDDLGDT